MQVELLLLWESGVFVWIPRWWSDSYSVSQCSDLFMKECRRVKFESGGDLGTEFLIGRRFLVSFDRIFGLYSGEEGFSVQRISRKSLEGGTPPLLDLMFRNRCHFLTL